MSDSDRPNFERPPASPGQLFRAFDFRARKRFGQHFLIDSAILEEIVALADVREGDRILEVGPGCGTLTLVMLQRGAEVDAVEIDRDAVAFLQRILVPHFPLRIHEDSALSVDWPQFLSSTPLPWKVVANLPYNVATKILFELFDARVHIEEMTLMFQREVARRIVAEAGDSEYGRLSLMSRLYSDVHLAMTLPPGAFVPPPRVHSAVVQFRVLPETRVEDATIREAFEEVVKAGFRSRRKTLANGLAAAGFEKSVVETIVEAMGLPKKIRPQRIDFDGFVEIARRLVSAGQLDGEQVSD